jgi:cell wall-associated NlpC family hydrolase
LHNLQTGDTLFISESSNPENYKATHFAIYLGKNLYISKFGPSGKLIVTDMDNMMKGFGGNYIFKMTPKF